MTIGSIPFSTQLRLTINCALLSLDKNVTPFPPYDFLELPNMLEGNILWENGEKRHLEINISPKCMVYHVNQNMTVAFPNIEH